MTPLGCPYFLTGPALRVRPGPPRPIGVLLDLLV